MATEPSSTTDPHEAPASGASATETALEELRMNFGDHLEELRKRLILSLIGVACLFVVMLYYGASIVVWLLKPLIFAQRQAGVEPMTVAGITSGFTTYILVAAVAALIVGSPWVLYQLWQFIGAGLYPAERKMILTLAPLSAVMSAVGVSFLYYVLLPVGLFFFLSFTASYPMIPKGDTGAMGKTSSWINHIAYKFTIIGYLTDKKHKPGALPTPTTQPVTTQPAATEPSISVTIPIVTTDPKSPVEGQIWLKEPEHEVRVQLDDQVRTLSLQMNTLLMPLIHVGDYLKFVVFLALGVVIAFQTPVVMLILGWTGLISASTFRPYRRHALLVCFVLGAILTPPDPVTMTMLATPMYLLFELGLLLMRFVDRKSDHADGPPIDSAEES